MDQLAPFVQNERASGVRDRPEVGHPGVVPGSDFPVVFVPAKVLEGLSTYLLDGEDLSEIADITDFSFRGASFNNTILTGVKATGVDFTESNGLGAELSDAYLSDADLSNANLATAVLVRTDLQRVRAFQVTLREATLIEADLSHAYMSEADLSGANLGGAKLIGADLTGAVLKGANLGGAVLREADLRGATLKGVNLIGADLSGVNLMGASLDGSIFNETTKWPSNFEVPIENLTFVKSVGEKPHYWKFNDGLTVSARDASQPERLGPSQEEGFDGLAPEMSR